MIRVDCSGCFTVWILHEKDYEFTIWDEKVKELQGFKIGDIIEIKGFDIRKKNGENEYHLNGKCKIEKV